MPLLISAGWPWALDLSLPLFAVFEFSQVGERTVHAPGLGQVGKEEGQVDKGGEVGLSKEGLRLCWADLEGSRVPGRSSVPSDPLGPSLRKSRVQRGQGQALSHTAKLVAELGPETQVCRPHPSPVGKNGEITMSFQPQ